MKPTALAAAAFLVSLGASAQDYRALTDSIGNFQGLADEVRKNNPVLAVSSGQGIADALKNLKSGRKYNGKGQQVVTLPPDQQAALEKRLKAQELAAERAKRGPVRVAAAPRPVVNPGLQLISPLMMQVIFSSPARPNDRIISEEALGAVRVGQDREGLLQALGEPRAKHGIAGLEGGSQETLVYDLADKHSVSIKLDGGIVARIVRN